MRFDGMVGVSTPRAAQPAGVNKMHVSLFTPVTKIRHGFASDELAGRHLQNLTAHEKNRQRTHYDFHL